MDEISREGVPALLAAYIETSDLTTRRTAKAIGCSEATIMRLLAGKTLPSDEMMKQVALMIELGIDSYLRLTPPEKDELSGMIGAVVGGCLGFGYVTNGVRRWGVRGLSAPGITSGLAALGAKVGGGMNRGVLALAGIPLVAGAAGYVLGQTIVRGVKYFASEAALNVKELDPRWEVVPEVP